MSTPIDAHLAVALTQLKHVGKSQPSAGEAPAVGKEEEETEEVREESIVPNLRGKQRFVATNEGFVAHASQMVR